MYTGDIVRVLRENNGIMSETEEKVAFSAGPGEEGYTPQIICKDHYIGDNGQVHYVITLKTDDQKNTIKIEYLIDENRTSIHPVVQSALAYKQKREELRKIDENNSTILKARNILTQWVKESNKSSSPEEKQKEVNLLLELYLLNKKNMTLPEKNIQKENSKTLKVLKK